MQIAFTPHPVLPQRPRPRLRQPRERELRGAVEVGERRPLAHDRQLLGRARHQRLRGHHVVGAHVHDVAPAPLDHARHHRPPEQEAPPQVRPHDRLVLPQRLAPRVLNRVVAPDGRVVHEDVDPAEPLRRQVDRAMHVLRLRDVRDQPHHLAARPAPSPPRRPPPPAGARRTSRRSRPRPRAPPRRRARSPSPRP